MTRQFGDVQFHVLSGKPSGRYVKSVNTSLPPTRRGFVVQMDLVMREVEEALPKIVS